MLDIENSLVVLIDIQERLVGMLNKQEPVVKATSILASASSIMNIPMIITEQYPKGLGSTIMDIASAIDESTPIIEKTSFSAMLTPEFAEKIKSLGKTSLSVIGDSNGISYYEKISCQITSSPNAL